jgi:hypothetical protein
MSARTDGSGALRRLRAMLEGERGPLAAALRHAGDPGVVEVFAPLVARGERTGDDGDEYALLVESILEGYLLHYDRGRILAAPDSDLRLLAGDYLYAFGLERLGRIGDLEAVDELSDLISLCAQAHSLAADAGTRASPWPLTGALWALSVLAIASGRWPEQAQAKRLARVDGPAAFERIRDVAIARAATLGLRLELERALIGFGRTTRGSLSRT